MKRILVSILLCATALCAGDAQTAADYKAFIKERKAMASFTKDQMKEKVSKDAKKAAKCLAKEGWMVAPGALPLERQLDRAYTMQYEFDMNSGMPKYIRGEAQTVGENYDAAKMQANALAKIDLAGNIQTEVAALIESRVSNNQMEAEQAASVSNSVMGAKNIISQSIGRTIIAVEMYRQLPNKNKEVRLQLFYNTEMALAAAKKGIKEEMSKTADKLVDQLDSLLGF
ncbi:MAG: hypothetical protein K2O66_00025 [Bacteroidales bacterium]|nr:hypothetical protein [Bacteroidales bacterium]MDE7071735.1 hypothetical protein [Bacteroidales bacterium]